LGKRQQNQQSRFQRQSLLMRCRRDASWRAVWLINESVSFRICDIDQSPDFSAVVARCPMPPPRLIPQQAMQKLVTQAAAGICCSRKRIRR
jgi:hypothetical protein